MPKPDRVRVSFALTPKSRDALNKMADRAQISRSTFLSQLVWTSYIRWLEATEIEKKLTGEK